MVKPIMVVSSDLHLEPNAWKNHPSLSGDAYYGLEQLVDIAAEYEVKALALLGDVFNVKTPDSHTVAVCYTQMERCRRLGIKVPFLQGQHELARRTPWLDVHPWPMHIHQLCLEVCDGITAYGLDWTPPGSIKQALRDVPPEANLLLCHQVWGDFHGSKIEHECDFTDVPGHVRVLVTGDYHKHFTLNAKNGGGRHMAVGSPGSTCLQSINEDRHKACFVLYDDMSLRSTTLRSRRVLRFTADDGIGLDQLLHADHIEWICAPQEGVPTHIAKPIVQVTYSEDIPDAHARLTRAFAGRVHLFLVPYRGKPEEVQIDREARLARAAQGLNGALSLILPPGSEIMADATRLNNSHDPAGELACMKEEFFSAHQERQAVGD